MTRISSSSSLRDQDTRSLAPAHARVLQSIAGRVLYLAELIQGRIPVTLGRQVTPPNPQGLIGIDHSGPPFGSAFRHPLLVMGGALEDVSGNCAGQRVVGRFSDTDALTIPLNLYVRPFATWGGAPYSRGFVSARVARVSGSGSVDFDIVLRRAGSSAAPMRATNSVSSTTPAHCATGNAFFHLSPGHNALELEFQTEEVGVEFVVEQFQVWQSVKRSHL